MTSAYCVDLAPPPLPSDGNIKLAWGEQEDGAIVHISEAGRGLTCKCKCPGCGAPLIAYKKGKAPHFGHYRGKACRIAYETAIHKLAKQILERERRIKVPAVEAHVGSLSEQRYQEMEIELDEVWLEHFMDGMRPDLYARKGTRHIAIEVAVTHRCGDDKLALIRDRQTPTVEIYIGHLRRDAGEEAVGAEITSLAPRVWLFNPYIEEMRARLQEQVRDAEDKRRREEELEVARRARKAEWELQRFKADVAKIVAAAEASTKAQAASKFTHTGWGSADRLREAGWSAEIDLDAGWDACFTASRADWQGAILHAFIYKPLKDGASSRSMKTGNIIDWMRENRLIREGLDGFISEDVAKAVSAKVEEFQAPFWTVRKYLSLLNAKGYVYKRGGVHVTTETAASKAWGLAQKPKQEPLAWQSGYRNLDPVRPYFRKTDPGTEVERRGSVEHKVLQIITSVDDPSAQTFNISAWMIGQLPGRNWSPADACRTYAEEWYDQVMCGLELLLWMIKDDGPIPLDMLGLPLAHVADRRKPTPRIIVEMDFI